VAIAFVNGSRGGNTSSSSSIATTATSLTAGNFTAVAFVIDDGTITPSGVPTDTAGNTYVQVGTTQTGSGGGPNICMFRAYNCLGNASNTVTLSLSGSSTYRAWARWQLSGVPTSDPYISPFQFGSATSAPSNIMSTATVSHGSGEAVFLCLGSSFGNPGCTAGGTSYTFNAFAITGDAVQYYGDQYLISSSDNTPQMTDGDTSAHWSLFAAAFGTPVTVATRRRLLLLGVGN
jgi:hypothetical protein